MLRLKGIDYTILSELMKNSKISDRKLAKKIGVSQPTVTRRRARLEKEGLISYTAIPNFLKFGFEIMAFNFVEYDPAVRTELQKKGQLAEKIQRTLSKSPNMIFSSSGRGLGMQGVSVTLHKSYSDYVTFRRELEDDWGEHAKKIESFIVSLKSDNVIRQPSFKYLADHMK